MRVTWVKRFVTKVMYVYIHRLSANTEVKRSCLAAMTAGIESVEKSQDDDVYV